MSSLQKSSSGFVLAMYVRVILYVRSIPSNGVPVRKFYVRA